MKGQNQLIINQDTMREAMQGWVDKKFAAGEAPYVQSVNYCGEDEDFFLDLTERNDPNLHEPVPMTAEEIHGLHV